MKRIQIAALAVVVASCGMAADPYAGYIYPSGIQAGTTNRFVIGGQNMWGEVNVHFGHPGLHVLNVERVPGFAPPTGFQRRHLKAWLDGIAEGCRAEPQKPNDPHLDEWRSNVWWRALDTLDAGQLAIVERDLYTPRNALQETPSLRQMMLVTVAADADVPTGRYEFSLFGGGGMSAPRPFDVSGLPHAPEPLYVPPHRPQPPPTFADVRTGGIVLDGQIMPGSTDAFRLRLAAGRRYAFRVTARELQPYVGDAVPGFFNAVITLKDAAGTVLATSDDEARFRPDPVLAFTPSAEGDYLLEIHDVLYRGRADFVYAVAVDSFRSLEIPLADGTVAKPGAVSAKVFTITAPGPRVLEVKARRRGSPLDAVLTLRRCAGGEILAQWDDVTNTVFVGTIPQTECDPIGLYDFKEAGDYVAEITDRTGHGGEDYVWWLDVRRPHPSFEVCSTRSTLPMRPKQPFDLSFIVLRKDGFDGAVTIDFPESIRARNCTATSGVEKITAKLSYVGDRFGVIEPVAFSAHAEIGGKIVRVPVTPCDEYEQAFAWRHLVPAKTFLLRAVRGRRKQPR